MRRINSSALWGLVLALSGTAFAQSPAAFRVLMGNDDAATTRWDGTVKVVQAGRYSLEPWRFAAADVISGDFFSLYSRPGLTLSFVPPAGPVANGFILTASAVGDNSEFSFQTAQGDFSFRASEVPFGKGIYRLGERVYVDRVPVFTRLTHTPEEEDYPALAAGKNGDAWLAYVQFHHSPDADKIRAGLSVAPQDFKLYAEPTGGDQIWARRYSNGGWGENIPITLAGKDCYKTAVAVDGAGRAWVVWSENRGGNFDIFARAVDASGPKEQVQISKEPGADVEAVAATDSSGKVWIAWQGWRNGVAGIYASHQEGSGFSAPVKISKSNADEWDPAIAADHAGRVAVAWDSYRNGNYDVYARTYSAGAWGNEVSIAATARYEAYPSITFDGTGRLWVAYEEGGQKWGKDYGALDTPGIPIYKGRKVELRGLEPDGTLVDPAASLEKALIGIPNIRADRPGTQADSGPLDPDPTAAARRAPDKSSSPAIAAVASRNNYPRLAVDGSGRIWLAFRTSHPTWWSSSGGVWHEYLLSFNGVEWSKPIFLDHTDNLLDNRPALATVATGKLLIVSSSDGRRDYSPARLLTVRPFQDPYENDLWSQAIDLGPARNSIPVVAVQHPEPPAATPDQPLIDALQAFRTYRGGPDKNLRIVRGEFHRHADVSADGLNDGSLYDQWRYVRDAAALDWVGCCDHDNGNGREYTWWITQKLTDVFYAPGSFAPLFNYERSVTYPDGHRNVLFAERGIHVLPRLDISHLGVAPEVNKPGHTPDTQMLYAYLRQFHGVTAPHTVATEQGTDWRDHDDQVEPFVEIFQGARQAYEMPGGPRGNTQQDSISGWRPQGYVSVALAKGYHLAFEASSDHVSTHMSYSGVFVKDLTRESLMEAIRQRHVYAATDDILADVECGNHMLGDEFSTAEAPTLRVKLRGTSRFVKVTIIRNGEYVYTSSPNVQEVEFSWRDNQPQKDKTSYYYVRGEQDNGEVVWVSPLWITYTGR